MNKKLYSSPLVGSRAEIFLSQESVISIEQQHAQKELQYYKKQNTLLKKQLQQITSLYNQQKKELNVYKTLANQKFQSPSEQNQQMIQLFELQQNKIQQLETQLQILQTQMQKSALGSASSSSALSEWQSKCKQYQVKCREYENKIISIQSQHQREVATLKQKLMKLNATEIMMQKQKQKQQQKLSLSSLNPLSQELKPLSRKLRTYENFR